MKTVSFDGIALGLGLVFLSACSSTPSLETRGVNRSLTVPSVLAQEAQTNGERVLWGGVIVRSENLAQRTEIEVLAYPVGRDLRPNTHASSFGRFLIERAGYLETVDYAQGRTVTVVGTVAGIREGKVDRADYRYPVVAGEQLQLWPTEDGSRGSGVNFGLGIGFGF